MTKAEPISKERIIELKSMSIGFYGTIQALQKTPTRPLY